jgi:aspartate-semialdehyde dehydrogenase
MLVEKYWKFWKKKELAIDNLYLLASSRSAGSKINFNGKET